MRPRTDDVDRGDGGDTDSLEERVRILLADLPDVREVKMFGGLAFMVDERMVVSVQRGGDALLVRVDPDDDADLLTRPGASRAHMGADRPMGEGWITVAGEALDTPAALDAWVDVALAHHASQATGES